MLWTEELFGVKKPILAMLHLDALPGDPRFRRGTPLGEIVEHARADLHALQDGGVDGIIFSNEFSFPYQRKMDMVTPAAMAYIIGALRSGTFIPMSYVRRYNGLVRDVFGGEDPELKEGE